MMKLLKVNMSFDKVTPCLLNPSEIEIIKEQGNNSCVLFMKSHKIHGCLHSAEDIIAAAGIEVVVVGDVGLEDRMAAQMGSQVVNEVYDNLNPAKQPSAVFSERGIVDQPATKKIRKRVIDSKQPSAVISGERKKVRKVSKAASRRPQNAPAMTGKGVEAVMRIGEPGIGV